MLSIGEVAGVNESETLAPPPSGPSTSPSSPSSPSSPERMQRIVEDNFPFIWRVLRRLLPRDVVDDAAQETFVIATRKVARIEEGRERAYLFKTALRVAGTARSKYVRRREIADDEALDRARDRKPTPDQELEEHDRRRLLEEILLALPDELRTVFVLFELEAMSSPEIAELLEIPVGTAASRLRRAREAFHAEAKRVKARVMFQKGGAP